MTFRAFQAVGAAALAITVAVSPVMAQGFKVSRANLAKTASFTVTNTTVPKGGSKVSTVMRVEVKGDKARVDFDNPQLGPVRYISNAKGVFFYIPSNNVAAKQEMPGGVDGFLRFAFQQVNERLRTAKKTGTANVSGQMTDVYRDPKSGAVLYIGRSPGFRLPIKMELKNAGGAQTLLVSNIKTNVSIADARFALPAGAQVMDSSGAPAAGLGGIPR